MEQACLTRMGPASHCPANVSCSIVFSACQWLGCKQGWEVVCSRRGLLTVVVVVFDLWIGGIPLGNLYYILYLSSVDYIIVFASVYR